MRWEQEHIVESEGFLSDTHEIFLCKARIISKLCSLAGVYIAAFLLLFTHHIDDVFKEHFTPTLVTPLKCLQ
jgi:hypothetical protein